MKKVLVVEDLGIVRKDLCRILLNKGYQVLEAKNGAIGLQVARKENPDLIISNVEMPDLNGFGLMNELRKEKETASIPIIFISSIDYKEYLENTEGVGFTHFLNKPFEEDDLFKKIDNIFSVSNN